MLQARGAGEWRGTYLVDSVFLVVTAQSSIDLATEMLILSMEIHAYVHMRFGMKHCPNPDPTDNRHRHSSSNVIGYGAIGSIKITMRHRKGTWTLLSGCAGRLDVFRCVDVV